MGVDTELIRINDIGKLFLPNYVTTDEIKTTLPSEADLVTQSATKEYPLGTKFVTNDAIFRYCKAGAAMTQAGFLKGNYFQCPGKAGNSAGAGFEGAPYAAIAAGDKSFSIADTAATENLYEGAYLAVYGSSYFDTYRVIGNDASDGTSTTLYIATHSDGFKAAITTSIGITVYLNPYQGIRQVAAGGGYMSAMGYSKIASITSGYYFWLQTAGQVSGITGASTWPGQTQYYRDVYCNTDGSLIGYTAGYQRVGYLLSRTASDYGDNFIMLQLDQ